MPNAASGLGEAAGAAAGASPPSLAAAGAFSTLSADFRLPPQPHASAAATPATMAIRRIFLLLLGRVARARIARARVARSVRRRSTAAGPAWGPARRAWARRAPTGVAADRSARCAPR